MFSDVTTQSFRSITCIKGGGRRSFLKESPLMNCSRHWSWCAWRGLFWCRNSEFVAAAVGAAAGLSSFCFPPIDSKWALCPTIEGLEVGGSARERSFWLCYAWEAILETGLLCCSRSSHLLLANFPVFLSGNTGLGSACPRSVLSPQEIRAEGYWLAARIWFLPIPLDFKL